jgi:hypothetical protein
MALNGITFTLGQGGLQTPIPGSDYISGYLVYAAAAPSCMTLSTPQAVFSLQDAVNLGITNTYSDETAATATFTVSARPATGDVITVKVPEPTINGGAANTVVLATYTVLSTDTSTSIVATSLRAAINANSYSTGYVASGSSTSVILTARPGLGIAINGISTNVTESNPLSPGVITNGAFSGGVAGKLNIYYYQISEFFRKHPNGKLWIGFYAIPGTYTFTELNSMQIFSGGEIRQFMVNSAHGTSSSNITADLDAIQAVGVTMFNNYSPASAIYSSNIFSISDLSTLPNLRARSDNYVSCVIAQDGGAQGAWLSMITGTSVPAMGACLGTVALSKVENDIAWVGKFNVSNGTEDETISFANGSLSHNVSTGLQTQLDSYGYIFLINKIGITGSYWNDSHCACLITSDYAYIERNRVIGKAQRVIYSSFTPLENSDLYLNADGTLTDGSIRVFKDAIAPSMGQMVSNGEISAYSCFIDPSQNVQSTSTIDIVVNIVGIGIARNISVTLGYSLSI